MPIIIHSRDAEIKVCEMCRASGVKKAMFHCFTGDVTALGKILDAGYFVSFSGIITFKSSPLVECVRYAPLSRIFIETDSPYLAPVPHRGKTNEPAWVGLVGKKVAEIKQMDEDAVAEALRENFFALFGFR
jgi:TatD DNase family protein